MEVQVRDFDDALQLSPGLSVLTRRTGAGAFDFEFRRYLTVSSVRDFDSAGPTMLRVGPILDYAALEVRLKALGVGLLQSAEEHRRVSELPGWYRLLDGITPKSVWYDALPTAAQVEHDIGWPVFIKGERQTNRHRISGCLARSRAEFERILLSWRRDDVLHWQRMVCREWVDLEPVGEAVGDVVQPSAEVRCFFFRQQLVGAGPYWTSHSWRPSGRALERALVVAEDAAQRVRVPFVAVDVALTADGRWIVIECNDGQESGFAGVAPLPMWQAIQGLVG